MAVITAKGKLPYGTFDVTITGDETIKTIECSDLIRKIITNGIRKAEGTMANGYRPEGNTMLQAYAFLVDMFGEDNVSVDGDIGSIPYEEGVIY